MTDDEVVDQYDADRVVGSRIRALRHGMGMTQRELADRLRALGWEIDPTGITRLEQGGRALQVRQLMLLAQVFNVPPADLLTAADSHATWAYREALSDLVNVRARASIVLNHLERLRKLYRDGAVVTDGPASFDAALSAVRRHLEDEVLARPGATLRVDEGAPVAAYQELINAVVSDVVVVRGP